LKAIHNWIIFIATPDGVVTNNVKERI